MQKRVVCPVI